MAMYSHEETQVTGAWGADVVTVHNGHIWQEVNEDDVYENTMRYVAAGWKSVAFTKGSVGQMTRCFVSEMTKDELRKKLKDIDWCYFTLIFDLENDKF